MAEQHVPLTDVQKDEIRAEATKNAAPLVDALAPLYLGRSCPLKNGGECDGPKCMMYAPLNDDPKQPQKITGGVCGILLGMNQLNELNNRMDDFTRALGNLALAQNTRILPGKI